MNNVATFFRESRTARFFIPLGIIIIAVGILLFVIGDRNKNYIKIEATVSKTELVREATYDADGNREEAMYNIFVKYTVDGQEYESELGEMFEQKIGDKINIVYNPDNPKEISSPSNVIINVCILIGGIVSLICGIISAINAINRQKRMKEQERSWQNGQ